jgi:hypothetical protein
VVGRKRFFQVFDWSSYESKILPDDGIIRDSFFVFPARVFPRMYYSLCPLACPFAYFKPLTTPGDTGKANCRVWSIRVHESSFSFYDHKL